MHWKRKGINSLRLQKTSHLAIHLERESERQAETEKETETETEAEAEAAAEAEAEAEAKAEAKTGEEPKKECADKSKNCKEWSANGECENNPGHMLQNCPVSCGTC